VAELTTRPLGALGAEVLQVRVSPGSRLNGVAVFELRLPEGAQVTLVVRDDEAVVPTAATVLRHGDELLVVTTETSRAEAERRLREVSSGGRLARWRRPPPPETR
jgi:cell volume regulation protein A